MATEPLDTPGNLGVPTGTQDPVSSGETGDIRLGIVGAGKAGTTIARAAMAAGYDVAMSGSGPADRIAVIVLAPGARAVTTDEVVRHADLIVLAVRTHRFRELPRDLFAGKILIDAMNYWEPIDGVDQELAPAPAGTSVSCSSGSGRREWSRVSISSATTSSKRTGVHLVRPAASRSLRQAATPPQSSPQSSSSIDSDSTQLMPGRSKPAWRSSPTGQRSESPTPPTNCRSSSGRAPSTVEGLELEKHQQEHFS
jgi:hypothetical protein